MSMEVAPVLGGIRGRRPRGRGAGASDPNRVIAEEGAGYRRGR